MCAVDDEHELLRRWRGGDLAAGNALFERHFDGLYRFFAGKVSRDVEDLIQQTMLACVEGRDRIAGESTTSVRAYLFGTARNVLYAHYRKHLHERFDAVHTSLEDLGPSPSRLVDEAVAARLLAAALRRIPLDLQILLELHYWERMSHSELATALGVSLGSVKGKLQTAKTQLRRHMAELAAGDALAELPAVDLDLDRWVAALPSSAWEVQEDRS
ncbi:RNA polymerase sigma factor [Nannocystis punicea]|uniref:RNA polymerase sigma factor n=1 Tax=Nannocystis punicea TaxID=2995304 RepID=UPI0035312BFE